MLTCAGNLRIPQLIGWLVEGRGQIMPDKPPTMSTGTESPFGTSSRAHTRKQHYRPGLALAAMLLLTPALIAVALAGVAIFIFHAIPLLVPFLLLVVLPTIPLIWILLVSVQTDVRSISAAPLLRPWREIPWTLIEHGERRGPVVTLTASDGVRVRFVPLLLRDGARLYRELLVRLPSYVLGVTMREDAQGLLVEQILPTAEGGLTGSLRTHPRMRWRIACALVAASAAGASIIFLLLVRTLAAAPWSLSGFVVAGGAMLLLRWFSQTILISHEGVSVTHAPFGARVHMAWNEIGLIEFTPRERIVRLRGDQRLVCAGPALLNPSDRDLMRAFFHAYCLSRGVPVARRRWLT